MANQSAAAQNEIILHSFTGTNGDGANPYNALIADNAGNLYGTTVFGGISGTNCADQRGCGTVFKLDPNNHETVLYSFTGAEDGAFPNGGLIRDSTGNLYGTTQGGGATGKGTVFKLDPSNHETVLYSFTAQNGDGANPITGLLMDSTGNLYGTTRSGGLGFGSVFKLDTTGHETVLYSFQGRNGDGWMPNGSLLTDSAGNIYGTTSLGGTGLVPGACDFGCGTVFKLDTTGHEAVFYSFPDKNGGGWLPNGSLLMDSVGNLYGITASGGSGISCAIGGGCGTVFKIDATGHETTLYNFSNSDIGAAALIMDGAGNLYGTTYYGGTGNCVSGGFPYGCGSVFKLDPAGLKTVLYSFTDTTGDGKYPDVSNSGGMFMDSAGNLYGTTSLGGSANEGTIFKLIGTGALPFVHTLTVASTNPSNGVAINVSLPDNNNLRDGTTQFTRTYNRGLTVTLGAPETSAGNNFSNWTGCDSVVGTNCIVTMSVDRTVTANYVASLPTTHTLSVGSNNPSSGVAVIVSILDTNHLGNGSTQFIRTYNAGATVTLSAPMAASGNNFSSWTGCDFTNGLSCIVTMNADRTVAVNYVSHPRPRPPLFVNGHELVGNELNNVMFVASFVIPQLQGDRASRIQVAARASWWGLKEGTFSRSDPHKFSSCNRLLPTGFSRDFHLRPLEVCEPDRAWQVGLAAVQVPNFSEQAVLTEIQALWPGRSVSDVLSEAAQLAGFDSTKGIGAAIVASIGSLKKSWLLRDPVVGLSLVERDVSDQCVNNARPYCYGSGWLQTKKYAPTRNAALRSIADLTLIYTALAP